MNINFPDANLEVTGGLFPMFCPYVDVAVLFCRSEFVDQFVADGAVRVEMINGPLSELGDRHLFPRR